MDEVGIGAAGPRKGDIVVRCDEKYFRPTEVEMLLGDPAKAKKVLKWDPCATSLEVGDVATLVVSACMHCGMHVNWLVLSVVCE